MSEPLPQQLLLMELLVMSGQIAVSSATEGTILWHTLGECLATRWITKVEVSPGLFRIEITGEGRQAIGAKGLGYNTSECLS